MADNSTRARRLFVRALGVMLASALLATFSSIAGAAPSTKDKLDAAKAEFEQLKKEIEAQQEVVAQIGLEAAEIAARWDVAYARWEQITEELRNTVGELRAAQDDFQALQSELEERAREAFIVGPGTELEFLLGASSMSDLSARMEYVDALSQEDADLATRVQNVKNALSARKADEMKLQADRSEALEKVETLQAEVDAKLAEQQAALDVLNEKKARAEDLVKDLTKQYKKELAALTGLKFYADGVFNVCPVAQPRAVYDGFGAPRYGGGYHPHAGNDIIAPQGTEIYATFDGYARASYNGLGGNSVSVYGDLGYTYNAHLMQTGYTGPVHAGQVIGYVGATGDTSTPHDHFEWHPNNGPAVDPHPYLSVSCG